MRAPSSSRVGLMRGASRHRCASKHEAARPSARTVARRGTGLPAIAADDARATLCIMRIRSPKDFWAGLIFVAIGGGFILLAQQYRLGDLHRMGPAMFPTLVGALLAGLGRRLIALRSFVLDGEPVPRFYARPLGVIAARDRAVRDRAATARPRRRGRRAACWSAPRPARDVRPLENARARRGADRVLGRRVRLAARPAAAALAELREAEWRRCPISRSGSASR